MRYGREGTIKAARYRQKRRVRPEPIEPEQRVLPPIWTGPRGPVYPRTRAHRKRLIRKGVRLSRHGSVSPFLNFARALRAAHPGRESMAMARVRARRIWSLMSDDEREPYEEQAERARQDRAEQRARAGAFVNFVRSMRDLFPKSSSQRLQHDSKALWREMDAEDKRMYGGQKQRCGPGGYGRGRRSRSRSKGRSRRRSRSKSRSRSRSRSRRRRRHG